MNPARLAVLVGVGNSYRRDDGVGPALAGIISELDLPGVTVLTSDGEPTRLLDAWSGASVAVVVDAMRQDGAEPGQIRRLRVTNGGPGEPAIGSASTHGLGIAEAIRLAQVLGQMPERLVVFTVQAADIGYGEHLSPPVNASLPDLTNAVRAELER